MASRDKVDVDTFHKGIQYALESLGKSKFGLESTTVSNFKSKSHEGSGNELVDYSRVPCLSADQKARGLWERDWHLKGHSQPVHMRIRYHLVANLHITKSRFILILIKYDKNNITG